MKVYILPLVILGLAVVASGAPPTLPHSWEFDVNVTATTASKASSWMEYSVQVLGSIKGVRWTLESESTPAYAEWANTLVLVDDVTLVEFDATANLCQVTCLNGATCGGNACDVERIDGLYVPWQFLPAAVEDPSGCLTHNGVATGVKYVANVTLNNPKLTASYCFVDHTIHAVKLDFVSPPPGNAASSFVYKFANVVAKTPPLVSFQRPPSCECDQPPQQRPTHFRPN